jgi:hypothetical protein
VRGRERKKLIHYNQKCVVGSPRSKNSLCLQECHTLSCLQYSPPFCVSGKWLQSEFLLLHASFGRCLYE